MSSSGTLKDIDRVSQASREDHPVGTRVVPDPDLFHAFANGRHGLEVIRLFAALDLVELVTRILFGIFWKVAQGLKGVTQESHWFHG